MRFLRARANRAVAGSILKVRGDKGGPPYYVRWPDGHESLVYPGSDIVIEHKRRKSTAGRVPVTR